MRKDPATDGLILLDVPAGTESAFDESFLARNGHPVQVCRGPVAEGACPLLAGAGCAKFDQAQGIVFKLDLGHPQHRAVLDRYRRLARPGVPIRVLVRPDQAARYGSVLEGVQVWTHEPSVADLDGFAAQVEASDA